MSTSPVNKKVFLPVYEEYTQTYFETGRSPRNEEINALCKKYKLLTAQNTQFTYKNFSRALKRFGFESVQKYRTREVKEQYEQFHKIDKVNRADAIKLISSNLNITLEQVNSRLRRSGEQARLNKASQELYKYIKYDYDNDDFTAQQLAELHKTNVTTISELFSHYGIVTPIDYFTRNVKFNLKDLTLMDVENAHLYGLIWADGTASSVGQVTIALSVDDSLYLSEISASLVMNGECPALVKVGDKKDRFGGDVYSISITRQSFYQHVLDSGLPTNKEDIPHSIPKLITPESNYFWHFIRGFFEGDGCFTKNNQMYFVGFSVTCECADLLKKYFTVLGFKPSKTPDKSIYRLSINGTAPTLLFAIQMYKDAGKTVVMQRKFEKIKLYWANSKYSTQYPDLFNDLSRSTYCPTKLKSVENNLRNTFSKS